MYWQLIFITVSSRRHSEEQRLTGTALVDISYELHVVSNDVHNYVTENHILYPWL